MKAISRLAGISATAVLLAVSTSANAIVTSWDYTVSSLFTFAEYSNGSSGAVSTDTLSWGSGSSKSSLVIGDSPAAGSVDTFIGGGAPPQSPPYLGNSTSLTHNNHVIDGASLTSAVLTNTITLDPLVPDNPALLPYDLLFTIGFTETPNSAPCAVVGSPTPCNDIFVLTSGLLNSSFAYDDGTGLNTYFVNIFPTTGGVLSVLPDAVCDAVSVAHGCIGFTTPENQSTELAFGFTISTERLVGEPLPEPGSLALFGLGLTGLFAWRRKQAK